MFKANQKSAKFIALAQGNAPIKKDSLSALDNLDKKTGGKVRVRWNERTGVSRSIRGIMTEAKTGAGQDISNQFLTEHGKLFGVQKPADLQYVDTKARRGASHVKYRQTFQGLPVVGAEVTVHLDRQNRVNMVNGDYHPDIAVDMSKPVIQAKDAVSIVYETLGVTDNPPAQTELVIYPQNGKYSRAYKVMVSTKNPQGDWVYFVDAVTQDVLDSYNTMRFAQGTGCLYNSNPSRDSRVATSDLFDFDASKTLSGTYFTIKNNLPDGNAAPTGPGAYDFLFSDPANVHFDEVMVYYHLSRIAEFFRNLGYAEHTKSMMAYVHVADPLTGKANYDNAYFSPYDGAFYFGHGEIFNDLAKEDAVIYHEYAHSVVHAAQPYMSSEEAGALHEGYADYFAGSLSSDPKIGEFVVERVMKEFLRDLRNQKTYADMTATDVHADGEIWGGTCWDIYEGLGRRIADQLLYESLWYLPANATFIDAYEGVISADSSLFDAEHVEELDTIFVNRKIISAPADSYIITATAGANGAIAPSGAVTVTRGADQTFTITPASGYKIQQLLVDGAAVTVAATYTFKNVIAAHTINVLFQQGTAGNEKTVTVKGNAPWTDTGLVVKIGDTLTFAASGKVVYDVPKASSCGPNGASWTDTKDKKDPLWQKPHSGLIGKIEGVGAPFFIGEKYVVKAASAGKLLLGVNDFWYQGNTGEFTVKITVS